MQNSERLAPASSLWSELNHQAGLAAQPKRSHLLPTGRRRPGCDEDEASMVDAAHVGCHRLPPSPSLPSLALLLHLLGPALHHAHQPSDEGELRIRPGDAPDERPGGGLRGGGPGDDRNHQRALEGGLRGRPAGRAVPQGEGFG